MIGARYGFAKVLLIPLFYFYSYVLVSHNWAGDQVGYRVLYDALAYAKLSEIVYYMNMYTGGSEPLTGFILWLGSNLGVEKDIYISIFNTLLLMGLYLVMDKYKTPWFIRIMIISNYYVIVLMTTTDRLKLAFVLLVWGVLMGGRIGRFLLIISPFAHLQSWIMIPGMMLLDYNKDIVRLMRERVMMPMRFVHLSGLMVVFGLVIILLMYSNVASKLAYYLTGHVNYYDLLEIAGLTAIVWYYSKNKSEIVLFMLPLIIAVMFLGGDRVNVMAFFFVVYRLVVDRNILRPIFVSLLIYFNVKVIAFLQNLYLYGDGYMVGN